MSYRVLGIGEVLWDLFPRGKQLGGAPANFAFHARSLGLDATVVSAVGQDELGRELLDRLKEAKVPVELIARHDDLPTGTVSVTLNGEGVPQYTINAPVAWDRLQSPEAMAHVRAATVVCFGSLAQRNPVSREAIQKLVDATPTSALRVFDINLRQQFYSQEIIEKSLQLANVLKLNEDELSVLATLFGGNGGTKEQVERLAAQFALQTVALTCGGKGSLLYHQGRWSEGSTRPVKVVDTVGAGDSFTAALVTGLVRGLDLDDINRAANELARYVCSCAGAMPELPDELRRQFVQG